jgi:hypothetical protein
MNPCNTASMMTSAQSKAAVNPCTPPPWFVDNATLSEEQIDFLKEDLGTEDAWVAIGYCAPFVGGSEGGVAIAHPDNAKHIVKCVNAHDEFVEVLRTVKRDCEMALSGEWDKSDEGFEDTLFLVDRALARVEGGQP